MPMNLVGSQSAQQQQQQQQQQQSSSSLSTRGTEATTTTTTRTEKTRKATPIASASSSSSSSRALYYSYGLAGTVIFVGLSVLLSQNQLSSYLETSSSSKTSSLSSRIEGLKTNISSSPNNNTDDDDINIVKTNNNNNNNNNDVFQFNSQEWIQGPRHGNVQDGISHEFVQQMILDSPYALVQEATTTTKATRQRRRSMSLLLKNNNKIGNNIEKTTTTTLHFLLDQTLCLNNSRFKKKVHDYNNNNGNSNLHHDEVFIRLWAFRFVYLAVHYHQHYHAIPEAQQRYYNNYTNNIHYNTDLLNNEDSVTGGIRNFWNYDTTTNNKNDIGIFDYECSNAKFIVVPLKGHGLGATVRTDIIPALMVGLITNRVVLLVNNVPSAYDNELKGLWPWASCPRYDAQCFFLPLSACVLSEQDLKDVHIWTDRVVFRRILRKQVWPNEYDHKKVWLFKKASGHATNLPSIAMDRLKNYSLILLENYSQQSKDVVDTSLLSILRKAIRTIGEEDKPRDGYNYAMAASKVHHAFGLYAVRPNPTSSRTLQRIHHNIINSVSSSNNDSSLASTTSSVINPEYTIGLPVRGSDKCNRESECLSFAQNFQVANESWVKHLNYHNETLSDGSRPPIASVIFTTESKQIIEEQSLFVANKTVREQYPFNFNFVHNTYDIAQDTGYIKRMDQQTTDSSSIVKADDVMMSVISTIQAQLLARTTVGNCCSHFHHLLNDLLSEGCGAASENTFMCLQESENPFLRPCCAWHSSWCPQQKQQLIAQLQASAP